MSEVRAHYPSMYTFIVEIYIICLLYIRYYVGFPNSIRLFYVVNTGMNGINISPWYTGISKYFFFSIPVFRLFFRYVGIPRYFLNVWPRNITWYLTVYQYEHWTVYLWKTPVFIPPHTFGIFKFLFFPQDNFWHSNISVSNLVNKFSCFLSRQT